MSTKIQRTYPQPDSPRENLGPRERALAVFKYLLDIEPENAVGVRWTRAAKANFRNTTMLAVTRGQKNLADAEREIAAVEAAEWVIQPHPLFQLVQHAFEQSNRVAVRAFVRDMTEGTDAVVDPGRIPQMDESLVEQLSSIREVEGNPIIKPFDIR